LTQSKAWAKSDARRAPPCLNAASYMRSDPASEPVCDAAAEAPFFGPAGLERHYRLRDAVLLMESMRRLPSFAPSIYMRMAFV